MSVTSKNIFELAGVEKIKSIAYTNEGRLTVDFTEITDSQDQYLTVKDLSAIEDILTNNTSDSILIRKDGNGAVNASHTNKSLLRQSIENVLLSNRDFLCDGVRMEFALEARLIEVTVETIEIDNGRFEYAKPVEAKHFYKEEGKYIVESLFDIYKGDWFYIYKPAPMLSKEIIQKIEDSGTVNGKFIAAIYNPVEKLFALLADVTDI